MDRDDHTHPGHEVHDALDGDLRLLDELEVPRHEDAHLPARNVVVEGDHGEVFAVFLFGDAAFFTARRWSSSKHRKAGRGY